jgi:hypothetical protein
MTSHHNYQDDFYSVYSATCEQHPNQYQQQMYWIFASQFIDSHSLGFVSSFQEWLSSNPEIDL